MRRRPCIGTWVAILTVACLAALAAPSVARGASSDAAPAVISASATRPGAHVRELSTESNGNCSAGQLVLNALNPFSSCEPLKQTAQTVVNTVAGLPGAVAGAVATGIMDQVTSWMVGAAQTITGWVFKEAAVITKPELDAQWYLSLFAGLAALGGALAGPVALIALGSAAIRRDPEALGEVLYGIGRAGIGTSIVVALTIIALTAADGMANGFARQMPADFYKTLASQWGASGFGGFGAAALAFLVAFVATIAGLLVWLELIVREAAIYIAVLFFPVALAASIWPSLRMWVRRLGMLLLMFVMLRPVVVIVLALAGTVTSAGLSFGNGSIPHSVGTILAGVVIFALAGFTPWVLMFLVGTEVGAMQARAGSAGGGDSTSGSAGGTGKVGGTLAPAGGLTGGREVALAGARAGGGSADDGEGGSRLASLGGSGSPRSAAGPVAAAAGWVGEAAGTVGRAGGHLSQHAAARIQAAAGRGGSAPSAMLPPWNGSAPASAGQRGTSTPPTAEHRDRGPGAASRSFADSVNLPPPSPAPGAGAPGPPSPAESAALPPPPERTNEAFPATSPPPPQGRSNPPAPPPPEGDGGAQQ